MARMAAASGANDLTESIPMTCEIEETRTAPPAAWAPVKPRSNSIYYLDYSIADPPADVVRCGAEAELAIAANRAMETHTESNED